MKYKLTYSKELPTGINGRCFYPLIPMFGTCKIVINPKYKKDRSILLHELTHVKQYRTKLFHSFMYSFFRSYRYKSELEAYGAQIKFNKYKSIGEAISIVKALYYNYDLRLSYDKIKSDVQKLIDKG